MNCRFFCSKGLFLTKLMGFRNFMIHQVVLLFIGKCTKLIVVYRYSPPDRVHISVYPKVLKYWDT